MLALVAIAASLLFHFTQERERQLRQRVPAYASQLLAHQIEVISGQWSRATQAIAQSPLTLRLLQTNDDASRLEQLDRIISLHPHLGNIYVISSDQANGQKPIREILSRQQMQMIETAHSAQNKAPVLHAEALQLSLSEPVRSADGTVIGHVLVARHLKEISALFNQSPLLNGYAELRQVGTNPDTLLKRGNEQL